MKELNEIVADVEAYYSAKELEINNGPRNSDLTTISLLQNRKRDIEKLKESINSVDTDITLKTQILTNYMNHSASIKLDIDKI
jgi:hypothetical protein